MKRKLIVLLVVLLIGTLGVASAYTWPTNITQVNSKFGMRNGKMHKGIDIPASQGAPCYAVASGKIMCAGTYGDGSFGNFVVIDIGEYLVSYAHLSKINVSVGQNVSEKEVIGLVGNTGRSSGPHLHFEVRKGNVSGTGAAAYSAYCSLNTQTDPQKFLAGATSGGSGSTQSNKCIKCGGIIGDKWYETTDGTHYKACTSNHNHQYNIGKHDYTGFAGNCKVCGKAPLKELQSAPASSIIPTWPNDLANKNNQTVITEKHTLFNDLSDSHWGFNEVKAMKELGIVSGMGDGKLGTNNEITAEEFLTLLSQVVTKKGLSKSQGEAYIPANMEKNWSYDLYVNLTKVLGNANDTSKKLGETEIKLILGNSDKEVLENYKKPITREKVANIMGALVKSNKTETSANEHNFKDWNSVNSTYKKRINTLKQMDIYRGVGQSDGSIIVKPNAPITRVEAIALVNRLYNAL